VLLALMLHMRLHLPHLHLYHRQRHRSLVYATSWTMQVV